MASAPRSPLLPTFQQLLGVTQDDARTTIRRWLRRAALFLGALAMLVTVGLLSGGR